MSYHLIIDSNFFLLPFEMNVDIFTEFERILTVNYECILLDGILHELEKLKENSKGIKKKNLENAIHLTDRCKQIEFNLQENELVDDLIVRYARSRPSIVASNDKGLKIKLKAQGIPIIYLRKKKYLKLEGIL